MTIIFVVGYIGLTILAGFGKQWAGIKVLGSVNLGFALIAFHYVLSWVLAIVYERTSPIIPSILSQKRPYVS